MARHTIAIPDRMHGLERRTIIRNDEARTVEGSHSAVADFQRIFDAPNPATVGTGLWHLKDPAHDHDLSQGRACRLIGVDAKTVRRKRPPDHPEIREEMKAIAAERRRVGYRRIGVMLERKGMILNHKKLYRLYTEEKLAVRRRRGRKRARGSAGCI